MAVDLGMGVDTRVPPGIHPQVVGSLEEFDEDTRPALQQVVDAFTSVYEGMGRVADAKAAAEANTAWTNDQRTIKIQDAADRAFQKFAPQFDKVYHNMRNSIAALEKELTAPIEAQGAHTISTQIRDHVKGLGSAALPFIHAAINKGDTVTVSAIMGAPAYLSGITPEMQATLLRQWHEKVNPQAAKRIRAMTAAMDLIRDSTPLIRTSLETLVGKSPAQAKALRDRNAAAEKALGAI